jgi:hypothetical protein
MTSCPSEAMHAAWVAPRCPQPITDIFIKTLPREDRTSFTKTARLIQKSPLPS